MKHRSHMPNITLKTFLKKGLAYLLVDENSCFRDKCASYKNTKDSSPVIQTSQYIYQEKNVFLSKENSFEEKLRVQEKVPPIKEEQKSELNEEKNIINGQNIQKEHTLAMKEKYSLLTGKYAPEKKKFIEKKYWDMRFQEYFDKSKKTPILWTYFSLGEDIFLNPSKNRREALQKIILSLGMKQGTHSFFPFTAPEENGVLIEYKEEFFAAISLLLPRLVVFFGKEGVENLVPNKEIVMMQEFIFQMPIRAIVLPCVNNMSASEMHKTIVYMKEYIRCISL